MVRQLTFQTVIPGCTTKDFYRIACSDSTAIKRFHLDVNNDDKVIVGEWDSDKVSRVLTYKLDMAIPATLKRFIGTEPVFIKEQQTCEWSDEQTLKITSIPTLQISMAKSLITEAVLYITTTSDGCQLDVTVTVSATVPWPLQSTVENVMADQAKQTAEKYVGYISKYVEEALTEQNNLAFSQEQELEQGQPALAEQETELAADTVGPEAAPVDQQQQLALAKQPKPRPEQPAAPIEVHATSASPAVPGRLQVAAPAASDTEVFYDAQEASSADLVLQTLLKELHQAKQDRQEANRLLVSIKDSVQQMERTMLKEAAFQEGSRYGQRLGTRSLLLTVTAAAAAASTVTTYVLMRKSR